MRRFLTVVLLCSFLWASVITPARAVLPVVAGAIAVLTEGTAATNALAALTVGTLVGMAWLKSQSGNSSDTSGQFAGVPTGTRAASDLSTPAGWSGPTSPPGTIAAQTLFVTSGPGLFSNATAEGSCRAYLLSVGKTFDSITQNSPTSYTCHFTSYPYSIYTTAESSCPSGYNLSGSSCVLANASAVQKPADGRCDVLATVSGFTVDPQDPECGGLAGNGVSVTPTKVTATKTNGDKTDITINGDGSRTITMTRANANGTTTTTTITTIPAQGGASAQITGTSQSTVAGTGALAGTGTVPLSLDLPTDYNRENTQQAIKSKLDQIDQRLDTTGLDTSLSGAKSGLDTAADSVISQISSIAAGGVSHSWAWPMPDLPAGGGCQPLAMTYKGHSASFDWCPTLELLRTALGWLAYWWTSIYLLRLFSRTVRGG